MIKNIIFDMGNVLMRFDPMALASHFASSQEDQKLLCEHVFSGPEWYALDAGSIDEEDALSSILSMMPDRLRFAAGTAISARFKRQMITRVPSKSGAISCICFQTQACASRATVRGYPYTTASTA